MEQDQLGTSVLYVEISYRTGGLIRAQSCNPGIEIEAGAVFCATSINWFPRAVRSLSCLDVSPRLCHTGRD